MSDLSISKPAAARKKKLDLVDAFRALVGLQVMNRLQRTRILFLHIFVPLRTGMISAGASQTEPASRVMTNLLVDSLRISAISLIAAAPGT